MLSLAETDQFDLGTDQIYVRRQEPQAGQGRWVDRLLGRFAPKEHMVHRGVEVGFVDAESGGGVALRIQVDEQGRALREGKPGCEVDGSRGLADPALLVDDRDDLAH